MKSFTKVIPVMAVALMMFSLPIFADNGTIGQQDKSAGVQVVKVEIAPSAGFVCFPFNCP
ncbi:MAG TPA: hypothetical protein VN642_15960 [Dongiaceae bacterium]|nr:hypothetical protein [Dongiaceae bacterium]